MSMQKVLVPLDGSDFSRQILPCIQEFLNPTDHQIVFLRVGADSVQGFTPAPQVPSGSDLSYKAYPTHRDMKYAKHPIYASQVRASFRANLREELRPDMNSLRDEGFEVSILVRFGEPAYEILDVVQREDVTMLAMTTNGRTGLGRLLFGSVAQKVMEKLKVPVLLLRPKERSRSGRRSSRKEKEVTPK